MRAACAILANRSFRCGDRVRIANDSARDRKRINAEFPGDEDVVGCERQLQRRYMRLGDAKPSARIRFADSPPRSALTVNRAESPRGVHRARVHDPSPVVGKS